jgi:DNA-binding response OmpR family regulator
MPQKILVVDDEREIVKLVRTYLEKAGFRVVTANDGQEGLTVFRHEKPDLVVLDLNLPRVDGLDVCRTIQRESDTPVIMLTARVEEQDRLIGLELGADDYIVKPFSPREVVARVRTVLRRTTLRATPSAPEAIIAGDVILDLVRHAATVAGQPVELTPTEFALLRAMVAQPGRAFSRMELLDAVQGEAYEGYERTIDTHIKNLRIKIEADAKNPTRIITVYGVGYKLAEDE